MKKLSKAQQIVVDAMQGGEVHWTNPDGVDPKTRTLEAMESDVFERTPGSGTSRSLEGITYQLKAEYDRERQ